VVIDHGFLVPNGHNHTVVMLQAKNKFDELKFRLPCIPAQVPDTSRSSSSSSTSRSSSSSGIPTNNKFSKHQDKDSFTLDLTTGMFLFLYWYLAF
jgi:hypothetical protein